MKVFRLFSTIFILNLSLVASVSIATPPNRIEECASILKGEVKAATIATTSTSGEIAENFLRNYWSARSGIRGAAERNGILEVSIVPSKLVEGLSVLPKVFRGLSVVLKSTATDEGPGGVFPGREPNDDRPVVLVTGSATGIGLALCNNLILSGYRVVMTARKASLQKLREIGYEDSESLMVRELDVTVPEQQLSLIAEINQRWGGVDHLINNAAIFVQGVAQDLALADLQASLSTNYLGPAGLIGQVLPMMRFKGQGRILNISSTSASMPVATMGAYSASKAALNAYSEVLSREVSGFGISVSTVELGVVNSGAHEKILLTQLAELGRNDPLSPYFTAYRQALRSMSLGRRLSPSTADGVAANIVSMLRRKSLPEHLNTTPDSVVFGLIRKLLPSKLYFKFVDYFIAASDRVESAFENYDKKKSNPNSNSESKSIVRQAGLIRYIIDHLTENLVGKTLNLKKQIISFSERLGRGFGGAVYRIRVQEGSPELIAAQQEWGQLAIKVPYSMKGTLGVVRFPHSEFLQKREIDFYEAVKSELPRIESAESFPKDAYWASGHMPVAPILMSSRSHRGRFIVKPELTGLTLQKIAEKYGNDLPPEMIASLSDLFKFGQALFEKSSLRSIRTLDPKARPIQQPVFIDLNPANMIWVEEPVLMAKLGLKRPGFVLYELGEYLGRRYQFPNVTFAKFVEEFKSAVGEAQSH